MPFRRATMFAGLGLAILLMAASAMAARLFNHETAHFADAEDLQLTTPGAHLYRNECARCHGRYMQGQPLWQLVDKDAGRRAPALDPTGRAWKRSDEELFQIIKFGRYAEKAGDGVSHMPAFEDRLDDRQILSILALLKGRWPLGIRALHALRNPNLEGMPAGADTTDWRLPATCFRNDS